MRKFNSTIHFISTLTILFLVGCQPKTVTTTDSNKSSSLDIHNLNYKYLSTKGKLEFDSPAKDMKLSVDTRIEKDTKMWMSMRVAKIEGLRVLATKDSVFALMKMEKEAYALSYDDVELLLGTRIDYDLLQSIFTGDLPSTFEDGKLKMDDDNFLLTLKGKGIESIALISRTSQKLEKIAVSLRKEKKIAIIDYMDFKAVNEASSQIAPYHSVVKIGTGTADNLQEATTVDIIFSRIQLEEEAQKMPFKIPSKYKLKGRADLEMDLKK
ncbi:DUF4292 domain-containing protein [Flammeovirga kamogawensis]|uniref:DUF4292 domain-containing protein n=1 Tax=Flammeovirga kamogawensis TaxID=373891 RepID=A0ABX8GVN6_9BACT|nr:DUF4292 domain-containing protein [Flammeovirga kamogawensis]MBB6461612.1 hypothetical protein [Flammeovirga kamogawensis]QWG07459.1 DUF4292 domain-containing protein [Flammeovirga kamogawensis]TRX69271.1 DUF4292 domain-containing protein [Flammeovirga kamogawensis]